MVAQVVKVERSSPRERVAEHPLLADIAAGIAHLRERGALSFGRAYVATTRTEEHQILLAARASGASTAEQTYLLDAKSAVPHSPSTLQGLFVLLRTLTELDHRSALFVPAPHLTAFAVAGLALPIVYGSGLLRRTPEPLPVVPWTSALDPAAVLNVIQAQHRTSAVLLGGRGVVVYGDEPISKLAGFVASLEESAQLTCNAKMLGGARELPPDAYEQMQGGIAGD